MKKKLLTLVTVVALALGGSAVAFANPSHNDNNDKDHNNCQQEDNKNFKRDDNKCKDECKSELKSKEQHKCNSDCQPVVTSSVSKGKDGEHHGKDCPTPPTDVCDNIDGAQATVPEGFRLEGKNCLENDGAPATEPTGTTADSTKGEVKSTTSTPVETAPVDETFQGK